MVQVAEASTPDARRIVASPSGALTAVVEGDRVLVYELPKLTPFADIGGEGDVEVVFARAGAEDRLIVIARARGESVLHIVDPTGPTKLDEVKLRGAVQLLAVVDGYLLLAGAGSTWLVDVSRPRPTPVLLPIRTTVAAAGRLGPARFLIAAGGAYEEWDAVTRKPARRLRVEQIPEPLAVGGNDRRIWIAQADRIEVVRFDAPRSRSIELDEPLARVVPHVRGDVLLAIGAATGTVYAIYLGRSEKPVVRLGLDGIVDAAWVGDSFRAVLRPPDGPLQLLGLPAAVREPDEEEAPPTPPPAEEPVEEAPNAEELPSTRWSRDEVHARLAAWRTRASQRAAEVVTPDPALLSKPRETGPEPRVHPGGWRGELAMWARAVIAGSPREAPTLDCHVLDDVAERLALEAHARHALMLLYGASLCGHESLAPVDIAAVIGWQWDEALGAGQLAAVDVVQWRRGRVRMRAELHAALDDRAPRFGRILESEAQWQGSTVVIVAPADVDAASLGAWLAPQLGTLFVPAPDAPVDRVLREANLRGAIPLLRWPKVSERAAIVVETEDQAATLGIPVFATWPPKI